VTGPVPRPRCGKPTRNGPCGKGYGHTSHCTSASAMTSMRDAETTRRKGRKSRIRNHWTPEQDHAAVILAGLALDTADPHAQLAAALQACGLMPYRRVIR
jgi:hypothetical protein